MAGGAAEGDQGVGGDDDVGSPSTGYQNRSPATKTSGSLANKCRKPPMIVMIHSN